jgi:hypothetical protein
LQTLTVAGSIMKTNTTLPLLCALNIPFVWDVLAKQWERWTRLGRGESTPHNKWPWYTQLFATD